MYGTREELCVQLENMFTFDEPLVLLVWTEEGISVACREAQPEPDGTEIRNLMKAIGEMKMTQYRQEGVNNQTVSDLLARQREAANRHLCSIKSPIRAMRSIKQRPGKQGWWLNAVTATRMWWPLTVTAER